MGSCKKLEGQVLLVEIAKTNSRDIRLHAADRPGPNANGTKLFAETRQGWNARVVFRRKRCQPGSVASSTARANQGLKRANSELVNRAPETDPASQITEVA